jgi:prolipoprotein diacylglyceryltransferase
LAGKRKDQPYLNDNKTASMTSRSKTYSTTGHIASWGLLGFLLASALCVPLVSFCGLAWGPYVLMLITVIAAFVVFSFGVKILNGSENYVLYRQMLFSVSCVSLALYFNGTPLLPYLDIYAIGFGIFHFFGRIGCFKAGCCHGRPSQFGIRYGKNHTSSGFPSYLANVTIFPTQLLESVGILLITAFCTFLFLKRPDEGLALTCYVTSYASLRFLLEFLRGDTGRPHFAGLSEAQWFSLLLLGIIAGGGYTEWWPASTGQRLVTLTYILFTLFLLTFRRINFRIKLSSASQLCELGTALIKFDSLGTTNSSPYFVSTSLGINLSLSSHVGENKTFYVCSVSQNNMSLPAVEYTFRQVQLLRFSGFSAEKQRTAKGILHIIFKKQNSTSVKQIK